MKKALLLLVFIVAALSCSSKEAPVIGEPEGELYVARGRELVKGLAACGYCHGEVSDPSSMLSGGRGQKDKYGDVMAANLTPSRSGIGDWETYDVMRAVRSAIGPKNEALSQEVHSGYQWISDEDLLSIIAYLNILPPINQEVKRRRLSFIDRNTTGLLEKRREFEGYVPTVRFKYETEYGMYLVDHVARCNQCHNQQGGFFKDPAYLAGGEVVELKGEEKFAPGITGSVVDGIGSWSEENIIHYLKSGQNPDGDIVDSEFCPVNFYANAAEKDLGAIAKYLNSIP